MVLDLPLLPRFPDSVKPVMFHSGLGGEEGWRLVPVSHLGERDGVRALPEGTQHLREAQNKSFRESCSLSSKVLTSPRRQQGVLELGGKGYLHLCVLHHGSRQKQF